MHIQSGRVVGMFGLPCSGKSTLLKILVESSREVMAVISSGDIARRLSSEADTKHMAAGNLYPHEDKLRAEILETVNKRRAGGAEVIFLDGFPRTPEQIQWLVENQLAGSAGEGCLVQIVGDDLIKRAQERSRDSQDDVHAIQAKINKQRAEIAKMDTIIFRYGIPYYTVMNYDLSVSVKMLAKFIGLKK